MTSYDLYCNLFKKQCDFSKSSILNKKFVNKRREFPLLVTYEYHLLLCQKFFINFPIIFFSNFTMLQFIFDWITMVVVSGQKMHQAHEIRQEEGSKDSQEQVTPTPLFHHLVHPSDLLWMSVSPCSKPVDVSIEFHQTRN